MNRRPSMMVVTRHGKTVRGDWAGGPYIELSIGTEGYAPVEVINVWDYESDEVRGGLDYWKAPWGLIRHFMREQITEWVKEQEAEWPEWYEEYQRY